jgi:heme/copper-type cytochrome/quinol oxidase subunit 2
MVWLVVVLALVVFIRFKVLFSLKGNLLPDSETLEQIWTVIPILILLRIAYPRIYLLCLQDARNQSPANTIKIIRNQWNWQRESSDTIDHLLDSDRIDLIASYEYPILIERKSDTRVLTIRTDVLHSLGIPRLGIKLDASPGRISITVLEASIPGIFLGSCYELCGRGHRAIPLHFVSL